VFRSSVIVAVCLLWSSVAAAQQPFPTREAAPAIVTSGEGIIKRAPDRAWLTLTVESRARTPREAQRINAESMTKVMGQVKGMVPADAIRTLGYTLQPEYDYVGGRQTLRGYSARNTVEVRVDDLPKAGEILELAVTAGATSAGGIRFDLKERDQLEREALKLAVEDARARAQAAAAGAALTIERIVRIEDHRASDMPQPRPMMMSVGRADMAQESAAPPIEAGEIEIRARVTLTAQVK
jgi:uncharacterized protein YggE